MKTNKISKFFKGLIISLLIASTIAVTILPVQLTTSTTQAAPVRPDRSPVGPYAPITPVKSK